MVATATCIGTAALIVAGASTAAAVVSTVAENSSAKKQQHNHTVYKLVDSDEKIQYVGRTTNVEKRKSAQIAMLGCHTINTSNFK